MNQRHNERHNLHAILVVSVFLFINLSRFQKKMSKRKAYEEGIKSLTTILYVPFLY
jgi:hypothetical protein